MKIKAAFLGLIIFLAPALTASAQVFQYQAVYLDTAFILQHDIDYPDLLTGKPDSVSAHFTNDGYFASRLTPFPGGPEVTMQKGQPLTIYYNILASDVHPTDSIVGTLSFQSLDENLILTNDSDFIFFEPGATGVEHEITFLVPDTGFNAVGLEIATTIGGNSLWIDAVALTQSGTASVAATEGVGAPALASYPNPFYRTAGTTLRVTSTMVGNGQLRIYDVLGNQVAQVPVGELTEGEQDVKFLLDRAGIFFARLFVNGEPNGAPLKITSE